MAEASLSSQKNMSLLKSFQMEINLEILDLLQLHKFQDKDSGILSLQFYHPSQFYCEWHLPKKLPVHKNLP